MAVASVLLILANKKGGDFEFLETEPIELDITAKVIAAAKRKKHAPAYTAFTAAGMIICLLSLIPILIRGVLPGDNVPQTLTVCITLLAGAVGAALLIRGRTVNASFEMLFEEGRYTRKKKQKQQKQNKNVIYWIMIAAIYLGYSIGSGNWHISWVIWPTAALLFLILVGIPQKK